MSMIKVENLTFSYPSGTDDIFKNVSFQIDSDWKLGFIGRNGRGKTTFFNLLLGKYEYSGKIISSVKFDYFPYPVMDKERFTEEILHEISPFAEDWEVIRELSYLGVEQDVLYRPFGTLSNGEQTKVLLAALFLNISDERFLLIDEPTNHLDLKAREIVSEYLRRKKSFILVSHDRQFLDGCVDHILSLNKSDIELQSGNFSSWIENYERRQSFEITQNERLKRDISHMKKAAERSAAWSKKAESSKIGNGPVDRGYIGHKAAKVMKRSKTIENKQKNAIEEKSEFLKNYETAENIKIMPLTYHADRLVSFSETVVCYNGNKICNPVSFTIEKGERVALDGKNGCGKSSLLKLIVGNSIEYTGTVTVGAGLIVSYVPQDTSHLKGTLSDYAEENQIDETLFKAILRKLDFKRTQFVKNITDFSAGQKKKVLIAKSLCEKAHLYIWDEPLNYIDIYSRVQIEQLIKEFSPTMIFVEHDKAFRDMTATKIVTV